MFGKISRKSKNTFTASSLTFPIREFALRRPPEYSKTGPFREKLDRAILGGKIKESKHEGQKNWILDYVLGSRERNTGVSDLLSGLKYSRSYSEALEALTSQLA